MKYAEINKRYTEIVAEYMSKGYTINTATMGGSQGEIAKIDLTDGISIIRIIMDRFSEYSSCLEGIEITIGKNTDNAKPNSESDCPTIWNSHLEIIGRERFYKIDHYKDFYGTKEEAERATKIRHERWRNKRTASEFIPSEKALEIAKCIIRNKFGYKRIADSEIKFAKTSQGYVVGYKGKAYRLH